MARSRRDPGGGERIAFIDWFVRAFERAFPLVLIAMPPALLLTEVLRRLRRARGEEPAAAVTGAALDVLLVLSVAAILVPTMLPLSGEPSLQLVPLRTTWRTLDSGEAWKILRLVGGNVLLFVPFGFFAAARAIGRARLWHAVLAGAVLSAAVEATQYLFVPGRSVEIDDVFLNTTGAAVGAALACAVFRHAPRWRHASRATSRGDCGAGPSDGAAGGDDGAHLHHEP